MTAEAVGRAPEIKTRVVSVHDETGGAKTFRLSVPQDFAFTPGMWVMLQFPDKAEHASAYSISSSPSERGYIEVSFCKVGALTRRLFELKGGDTLLLRGPFGKWTYRDDARHAVLISDGTGIAPLRSMARYALEKGPANRLTILYSARTPNAFLYEADLNRFSAAGVNVFLTVTHPEEASSTTWTGARGPIDIGVIERQVPDFSSAVYYLCGPKTFIESLSDGLLRRGVARSHIRYEKWGDYAWA